MNIAENWSDLLFGLDCISKQAAKRRFKKSIKYGWGGLCAYCREETATTLDHVRPKCKGGSSLRSNLIPCCRSCNHDKGSEQWLSWYKRQEFYNECAQQCIEDWISNKRFLEEQLDDGFDNRTEVCPTESTLRSTENEQTRTRKNCSAIA